MQSMIEGEYAERYMTWRVRGDAYRIQFIILDVLDHFLAGGIHIAALHVFGEGFTTIGKEVADGYHLNIRVLLKAKRRGHAAETMADQAHSDLSIRDRFPTSVCIGFIGHPLESENWFLFGGANRTDQSHGGRCHAHGLYKSAPRHRACRCF